MFELLAFIFSWQTGASPQYGTIVLTAMLSGLLAFLGSMCGWLVQWGALKTTVAQHTDEFVEVKEAIEKLDDEREEMRLDCARNHGRAVAAGVGR